MNAPSPTPLSLRVHRLERAGEGVLSVELRAPDGGALPGFTAGAHVDISLPNGLTRSYSLANDPAETHRYVLGIGLDPASKGGSRYVHKNLHVGDLLPVAPPRNHFGLHEEAPHSVLIAGGIGVTPILAMAHRLHALKASFSVVYAVREQDRAAYAEDLARLAPAFTLHCDDKAGGPLDITAVVKAAPAGSHFYCCGPVPMLAAYEAACAGLPPEQVHLEYFKAPVVENAGASSSFEVEVKSRGTVFTIPPDKSILDVLTEAGIAASSACHEGICGSCEVKMLDGEADHRDAVLTAAEKAANKSLMICVSRAKSPRLVLDL